MENPSQQRRKALRLKDFDYSNPDYVYFVTVRARRLSEPFQNQMLAHKVIDSLLFIREAKGIHLYCYCLMPDHLHLALSPSFLSGSVSNVLQEFKSHTTRLGWEQGLGGSLWQRSFFDHIARKEENLIAICEYILANPVRKGLVEDPKEWPYSGMLDQLPW
jgi:REP element-mobilizing transposase RayT